MKVDYNELSIYCEEDFNYEIIYNLIISDLIDRYGYELVEEVFKDLES